MNPILATFDFIAIIHIADRTDRYRECLRELKILDLPLLPGKVEFFPGQRVESLDGFPTFGARGGFLSHLALIREAQRRGVETLLILEDDFEVGSNGVASFRQTITTARTVPWEFLYLGHRLTLPPSDSCLEETKGPIITAHAVALRSSVFAPLAAYLEDCTHRLPGDPIGGPQFIDGAYSMFRARNPHFTTLVVNPSQVEQRSSRSDISPNRFDRLPVIRQVLGAARLMRNFFKQSRKLS